MAKHKHRPPHPKPPKHPHPEFPTFVWFKFGNSRVLLNPNDGEFVLSQVHIDQVATLSLMFTDAAGNVVQAPAGTTAVWTNSNPAAATDAVSPDTLSDVLTPVQTAVSQVTSVGVDASVPGPDGNPIHFTATIDETIVEGPIAGVKIVETFSPAA